MTALRERKGPRSQLLAVTLSEAGPPPEFAREAGFGPHPGPLSRRFDAQCAVGSITAQATAGLPSSRKDTTGGIPATAEGRRGAETQMDKG